MKQHIFICCDPKERTSETWSQLQQWLTVVGSVHWLGMDNIDEVSKELVENAAIIIVTDSHLLAQLQARFSLRAHTLLALPRASLPALINLLQRYAYTSFSEGIISKLIMDSMEERQQRSKQR